MWSRRVTDDQAKIRPPVVKKPLDCSFGVAGRELMDYRIFNRLNQRQVLKRRDKDLYRLFDPLRQGKGERWGGPCFCGRFGQKPDQATVRSLCICLLQLFFAAGCGFRAVLPKRDPTDPVDRLPQSGRQAWTWCVAQVPNSSVDDAAASSSRKRRRWAM